MPDTPYFTPAELRDRYPEIAADTTKYTDALINQYRALAEQAFEDACQRAFVPRTTTETSTSPRAGARLLHRDLRAITAITAATGTTAVTVDDLALDGDWISGLEQGGQYTITYTYGADTPPLRVKQAVMSLTREWMVSGPVTDRQTGIPVEGGGFISLALPGGRGGTFGLPEVDSTVAQYEAQAFVG